jgi:hypothetical protein
MQIRTQSGQVMYESEFRAYTKANGGPSWDITTTEVLEALGADVVFEGAQATGGTVYKAQKDAEQAKSVRQSRDDKLAETDWRFRSDMIPSQEWKDYCQALRDVPLQSGFPWTITWPVEPQ